MRKIRMLLLLLAAHYGLVISWIPWHLMHYVVESYDLDSMLRNEGFLELLVVLLKGPDLDLIN